MLGRSLLGFAVIALLAAPLASGQDDYNDEIRKLLDEGTQLYKQGKYAEAYGKFEQAFQKKPSNDLVYAFVKRVGDDVVAGMMSNADENIKGVGYRLFELAKPGEIVRKGKKDILRYMEDLQSQDHAVYRNAHWHLKNFGPWAVRFLVPVLSNALNDQHRVRVILCLTEMGTEATLSLCEVMDADNAPGNVLMKQNAAAILGNIKDERAVPVLKRTVEDANQPPEVKKFAHEALMKITRKGPAEWKKATDYYFELAEKYYYGHPGVILAWNRAHLVWRWDATNNKLLEREVPRFAFNEQLAEESLYDLLDLDENYVHGPSRASAWSLLACVHYAQALEAEAGVIAAEMAQKNSDAGIKPEDLENLKKLTDRYNRHNVAGKLPGKQFLYEALARCLKDGNALVGKAAIDTLKEMGRPEDLPSTASAAVTDRDREAKSGAIGYPLIEALTADDKRVRYAAAEAMVRINPQQRKLGMELVIPNLVDALGEQGVRVALLIYDVQDDNDRNYVNGMKKLLTSINIFPVIATSGSEGIIKAKQFPTEDVIIIQKKIAGQIYFRESDVRTPVVETVFDTLRDDVRTKNIPRVLLCEDQAQHDEAKAQFDQTAQGFVKKDVHKLDLKALMDNLFDSEEAKKDAKDRADRIAQGAAETLASIDITNTLYPYRDAVDALIKTVSIEILREDFIRIPACRALGHFGDQRALSVLSKVVNDKAEDAEKVARQKGVRLAAAKAMSEIYKATRVAPTEEIYPILTKYLLDGDIDIEILVGEALGNSTLTTKQMREVHNIRRINNKNDYRPTRSADDE